MHSIFISTDERNPVSLDYLANHGAILVSHLLTMEDRRAFGWSLMFEDVKGQVEQVLLSHGYYVYGHAMSSFAGGMINMRAAAGLDPRTVLTD